MANTIVTGGRQKHLVHLTAIDTDYTSGERPLHSIQFNPGSTGTDVFVAKADSDAGPTIMKVTADAANDEACKYFGGNPVNVVIDYSACTLSAGHSVTIVFDVVGSNE